MASSSSMQFFENIKRNVLSENDINIYVSKKSENELSFEIHNRNHTVFNGKSYGFVSIKETGTIKYHPDINRFDCLLDSCKEFRRDYSIYMLMSKLISSELFSGKYNPLSSVTKIIYFEFE